MRACAGCERPLPIARRVFKGRAYCSTCNARIFKRLTCIWCGRIARLPRDDPRARCPQCERKRPCVRCERTGRPIGTMSAAGPICNSCHGTLRHMRGQVKPIVNQGMCPSCRRRRQLQPDNSGVPRCRPCREVGEHPCATCKQSMPAGYGRRCETCYWEAAFARRLAQNRALFVSEAHERLFEAYAQWLRDRRNAHVATLRLNDDATFFAKVATLGEQVDAAAIVRAVPLASRMKLPMAFLRTRVPVDPKAQIEASEAERVERMLGAEPSLRTYYMSLKQTGGLSSRTIRVYLRAASGLLRASETDLLTGTQVANYLRSVPGQRASLGRYLRFRGLVVPDDPAAQLNEVRAARAALLAMIDGGADTRAWITAGLQFYHHLTRAQARQVATRSRPQRHAEWLVIDDGKVTYYLPATPSGGAPEQPGHASFS